MSDILQDDKTSLLALAVDVVSAYVGNNSVPVDSLPGLISQVYAALTGIERAPLAPITATKQNPAVNPKKSVFEDYIICLEDGKKFKTLKRHLMVHFGLTPDEYRTKWGLDANYPMVAPNYAASRSHIAKSLGLGRKASAE